MGINSSSTDFAHEIGEETAFLFCQFGHSCIYVSGRWASHFKCNDHTFSNVKWITVIKQIITIKNLLHTSHCVRDATYSQEKYKRWLILLTAKITGANCVLSLRGSGTYVVCQKLPSLEQCVDVLLESICILQTQNGNIFLEKSVKSFHVATEHQMEYAMQWP